MGPPRRRAGLRHAQHAGVRARAAGRRGADPPGRRRRRRRDHRAGPRGRAARARDLPGARGPRLDADDGRRARSPSSCSRASGSTRVVVPRELSVDEIRAYAAGTDVPLEVFVHGALCVAWSGQCLSSEAWGGRSANRGQCAQACRLPYELVVDGATRDLGEVEYLLSPKDLVGLRRGPGARRDRRRVAQDRGPAQGPALRRDRGRASTARAAAARRRRAGARPRRSSSPIDAASLARRVQPRRLAPASSAAPITRRSSRAGSRATAGCRSAGSRSSIATRCSSCRSGQRPVTGGAAIGADELGGQRSPDRQRTPARSTPRAGMGVVFDRGRPEEPEQGGPIFAVEPRRASGYRLRFGDPGPDLAQRRVGDFVWITLRSEGHARRREGGRGRTRARSDGSRSTLVVRGAAGAPLEVTAPTSRRRGVRARTRRRRSRPRAAPGSSREVLADKLGALGGTPFHLGALDASGLAAGAAPAGLRAQGAAPRARRRARGRDRRASIASSRRRRVIERAARRPIAAASTPTRAARRPAVPHRRAARRRARRRRARGRARLDGARRAREGGRARARPRRAGRRRDGARAEAGRGGDRRAPRAPRARSRARAQLGLARRTSRALASAAGRCTATSRSTSRTRSPRAGCSAHGLDDAHRRARSRSRAAVRAARRARRAAAIAVTIHHHIPTFHTEHCVYAHLLSTGRDYQTCGRPCEQHQVALRDRVGLVHPVIVDVGCRNTVFNAQAQSAASLVPELLARGVRRFRVELVRETADEAARVFTARTRSSSPAQIAPRRGRAARGGPRAVRRDARHDAHADRPALTGARAVRPRPTESNGTDVARVSGGSIGWTFAAHRVQQSRPSMPGSCAIRFSM